jgi:hypothetical protein
MLKKIDELGGYLSEKEYANFKQKIDKIYEIKVSRSNFVRYRKFLLKFVSTVRKKQIQEIFFYEDGSIKSKMFLYIVDSKLKIGLPLGHSLEGYEIEFIRNLLNTNIEFELRFSSTSEFLYFKSFIPIELFDKRKLYINSSEVI